MNKSTCSVKTFNGIPVLVPNIFELKPHHYISYNNHDTATYGSDTTAIVLKCWYNGVYYADRFLILNGNHFDALNDLDLVGCLGYFSEHIHLKSKYSDDLRDYLCYEPFNVTQPRKWLF